MTHLDHEEQQIEPVYLEQHDSPAIKEMGKQFAKAGPSKAGPFMAWISRRRLPRDAAGAHGRTCPRPVVAVMAGVFGRSYRKNVAPVWKA